MVEGRAASETTRERIVAAAARLLDEGGSDAVSTRAVGAAAGIQAPTLYRLFGDKQGLLDAVAVHGFATYLEAKLDRALTDDPVEDLRDGWDLHVGFGLAHPALFTQMYAARHTSGSPPAAVAATEVLAARIHRIAAAGRLRVSERRASELVQAAGRGTVLTLIAMPEQDRDLGLSAATRDAVIAAITSDVAAMREPGPAGAAVALRAVLAQTTVLSAPERALLDEWLGRLARDT